MAIIKCKMCGGDLELVEGIKVCECEYCGTKQTVPDTNDEKRLNAFIPSLQYPDRQLQLGLAELGCGRNPDVLQ